MARRTQEVWGFSGMPIGKRSQSRKPEEQHGDPRSIVGRAFRGGDGLIRWITHLSTRNYYSLLWRNEADDVWHSGGIVKADKWQGGEEVPAPEPGQSYRIAGATGIISERTLPTRAG